MGDLEEFTEKLNDAVNPDPEEQPEGGTPEEKATEPQTYEIDGEKVTLDQLKAWKQGGLMQADYTRKTQEIARERESLKASQQLLTTLAGKYEEALTRLGTAEDKKDTLDAAGEEIPAALRKELKELRATVTEIRESTQKAREEEETARSNAFITETADGTIRSLMAEKKIPEKLIGRIRSYIIGQNPDLYDPITGQISKESIAAAVKREFEDFYKDIDAWRLGTLNGLKREPAPKPTSHLRPAAPKKPDEKPKSWDTADTSAEFMELVAQRQRGAQEY